MDVKILPMLCAVILSQGWLLKGHLRSGLSIGGLFFKLLPAIENPDVRAKSHRKVKLYIYDRAPPSNKGRRSPKPSRRDYRLINTRRLEDIVYRLNTSLPTVVFVHGFMETDEPNVITKLVSQMNQTSRMNILLVDWHTLSAGPWYPWAMLNVPAVGRYLAHFLDSLARKIDQGTDLHSNDITRRKRLSSSSFAFFKNLHVVGFSLGAHVAGIAGHHVSVGRIGRITGIEPAYPMVDLLKPKSERLDSSDADFVDVIHTCGGNYGVPDQIGHVDFYPNGGKAIQPGCEKAYTKYSCSHWRGWEFFAESAMNEKSFESFPCRKWKEFENGSCGRRKDKEPVYMGFGTRRTARGKYYLRTHASSPYSITV